MVDIKNNPRNTQSSLFKQLTKLLSGPIINRRTQIYRQERRKSLDKYSTRFQSASGKEFKKSQYNPFESLQTSIGTNYNRGERYAEFDQMEYDPILASALDIYADEMTTSSSLEEMLVVESPNEEIKELLRTLYYKILNVESNLFGWCRNVCKYGDFFLYLDIDEQIGVKNVIGLPNHEVERLEGEDETNPNYIQYQWNSAGMTFENWQVAHFRILSNDKYSPYGTSVLEPARRIFRQLTLLEDAMMAYRVIRSPERRVFYIDVGNVDPQDVEQYMQKIMTTMKRNQIVDPQTGRVDLRYNPLSIEEDLYIPVRGNASQTKIETLAGGQFTGDIDDVKYLRDKLFAAIKIPQSYLSRGEGGEEDKTTLAQKDIRFARTIQRLQKSVISELEKIGIIHLYVLGYKGDDLISHKLYLNNPSRIAELQELEYWKTRFDVASSATENFFSKRWIAKNLFGLSDEEFLRNQRELFYDRSFASDLEEAGREEEVISQELTSRYGAGAGLGTGGEEFGQEQPIGGETEPLEPGEEVSPEEGTEETPEEEEEELDKFGEPKDKMIVGPGKREDGKFTTTARSKGKWYKPVKYRGGDRQASGARKRNYLALAGGQKAKGGKRNVLGTGALELFSLADGVLEEKKISVVSSSEEQQIFKTQNEIRMLIENLDRVSKQEVEKEDEAQ
jgi:hypothetical protein